MDILTVGDDAEVTTTFVVGDVPTDPTTVVCYAQHDDALVATAYVYGVAPEVTRVEAGTFRLTLPLTMEGGVDLYIVSTGAAKGAVKARLYVSGPGVTLP